MNGLPALLLTVRIHRIALRVELRLEYQEQGARFGLNILLSLIVFYFCTHLLLWLTRLPVQTQVFTHTC